MDIGISPININLDPIEFDIGTPNINIGMNVDTDKIGMKAGVDMNVTGAEDRPLSMLMLGNKEKPIALSFELPNFPRFSVDSLQKFMSMRFSLPSHHQLCFKVLGKELFSICMSGEGQAITQPYVPNAYERCEVSCCEEDTTPFPEQHK